MAEPKIIIRDLCKTYHTVNGDIVALDHVDLDIFENEFVTILGPSGCGKSTLLNILAGLETYEVGTVEMNGKPIIGPGNDRGVIFQEYALFPWLTVRRNVEFGLRNKGYTRQKIKETADYYIKMVDLQDFARAYPKELSGGMKQRVAIARGYAISPDVLLMDEPFGALDAQTRIQLQEDLLHTWEQERKTCFFITHDVEEAVLLAQRVVLMSARPGRIKEIIDIDLPYPRNQETKLCDSFIRLKNQIGAMVYKEYLEVRK